MSTDTVTTDTFEVFGTTAVLLVTGTRAASQARAIADGVLADIDAACNRFRPDSELVALNAAGGEPHLVSATFAGLISAALRAARLTGGDVDPTCGAALAGLGYDRDFAQVRAAGDAPPRLTAAAGPVPGWRSVHLDRTAGRAWLDRGTRLDLGATAIALAADLCAAQIAASTGCGVLVSLGGDVAVGGTAPAGGWQVKVTDDHAAPAGAPGQTVTISSGGLATSSTTVRTWRAGGTAGAPHHRPGDRRAGQVLLAHRQRRGGQLHRREHRQYRRDHPGAAGTGLAARPRTARAAGPARRHGRDHSRLAARQRTGGRGVSAPVAIVVNSSTPLWYATRATGLVALVLLTASMTLGLLSSVRYQRPAWPRFVTLGLHRNLSLLALAFTVAHVLTTVLDSFVSIPLQDAVVPFISSYRPLWVGFGAIAFDLMIALTVTSLLRTRMGLRSWRVVHWTAYLCWPVAVLHGLGTGTDTTARWVLRADRRLRAGRHGPDPVAPRPGVAVPAGRDHRGRRGDRAGADRGRCLAEGRPAVAWLERAVRHPCGPARGRPRPESGQVTAQKRLPVRAAHMRSAGRANG